MTTSAALFARWFCRLVRHAKSLGREARYFLSLLIFSLLGLGHAFASSGQDLRCLRAAYPDFLEASSDDLSVRSKGGEVFLYDGQPRTRDFADLLDHTDLKAQMSQPYPAGMLLSPPLADFDPGRLRSQVFFAKMYGSTQAEVESHIEWVDWAPCRCRLAFTGVNGAARKLAAVGRILGADRQMSAYVATPNGTFNWRAIQGSHRRSMHAHAAAVDFVLPHKLGAYWLWAGCKASSPCRYPERLLGDATLREVVRVFENHGFIWGGKWSHFDSMHFEYRPELVGPVCAR